jgi:hypothetical protein
MVQEEIEMSKVAKLMMAAGLCWMAASAQANLTCPGDYPSSNSTRGIVAEGDWAVSCTSGASNVAIPDIYSAAEKAIIANYNITSDYNPGNQNGNQGTGSWAMDAAWTESFDLYLVFAFNGGAGPNVNPDWFIFKVVKDGFTTGGTFYTVPETDNSQLGIYAQGMKGYVPSTSTVPLPGSLPLAGLGLGLLGMGALQRRRQQGR